MSWFGDDEDGREWPKVGGLQAIVFCVFAVLFWIYIITDKDGYLGFLDNFNLLIHEGGHMVFMPFGDTMQFLGGSLFQCIVPFAFAVSFWRSRQPAGFAFSGILLGENFLYVAHYIADAQDMSLPLVGSGEHDWNTLLAGTRLLAHCRLLGGMVYMLGWVIMLASTAWYFALYYRNSES
jgi:hypothetical protein